MSYTYYGRTYYGPHLLGRVLLQRVRLAALHAVEGRLGLSRPEELRAHDAKLRDVVEEPLPPLTLGVVGDRLLRGRGGARGRARARGRVGVGVGVGVGVRRSRRWPASSWRGDAIGVITR